MMRFDVETVKIVEVGPRDGLQNEKVTIPTEGKVAFVEALVDAGLTTVETGAFVHPKWVPQRADAEERCRRLPVRDDVRYTDLAIDTKYVA